MEHITRHDTLNLNIIHFLHKNLSVFREWCHIDGQTDKRRN